MNKRPKVIIDEANLYLMLARANRRSSYASHIKNQLDDLFHKELGRITQTGTPLDVKPPEDGESIYISTRICVGSRKHKDVWVRVLTRNPTDLKVVFDDFSSLLLSATIDNAPLMMRALNINPSLKRIISSWVEERGSEIKGMRESCKSPQSTLILKSTGVRVFSDFILSDDKGLIDKIGKALQNKKGKGVATIIYALRDLGLIRIAAGEYSKLYGAIRAQYKFNIGSNQGITAYLSKRLTIPKQELDDAKRFLQS